MSTIIFFNFSKNFINFFLTKQIISYKISTNLKHDFVEGDRCISNTYRELLAGAKQQYKYSQITPENFSEAYK